MARASATEAGIALTAATLLDGRVVDPGTRLKPVVLHGFVRAGFAVVLLGLAGLMLVLRPDVPAGGGPDFAMAGFGMGLAYSPMALIVLASIAGEPGHRVQRAVADRYARDGDRDRA